MSRQSTLLVVVLLFILAGCSRQPPPPKPEVARPAKIFTVEAPGSNLMRTFFGEVRASDQAQLAFRVGGELIQLPASRGMQVKRGDLLARLDPSDYQARLNQAAAEARLARAQFERAAELIDRNLISKSEYDQNEARAKVTAADLVRAQNDLSYTEIFAPFDGVIAQQLIENFESVNPGQVVLILQTEDMVDVIVDVPESIIARAARNPNRQERERVPVQVQFSSISEELFPATYKEHETTADPATLTFKVTFSLPVPAGINVLPGMTATLFADLSSLFDDSEYGYLLPVAAVFSADDQPLGEGDRFVWKVDPESMRAGLYPVTVGNLTGNSIVVFEGVNEGDMVVAAGVNAVQPGMLVREMTRESGL